MGTSRCRKGWIQLRKKATRQATCETPPSVISPQVVNKRIHLTELDFAQFLLLRHWQRRGELVGKRRSSTVVHIKPFLCSVRNIGGKIDVEKWGSVGRVDPKATGNLPPQLGQHIEIAAEQCPMRFNPRITLTEGDEHNQQNNPIQGKMMYLGVIVAEEIPSVSGC